MTLYESEKRLILATLAQNNSNRTHTARQLDIGLRTLQRKLIQYAKDGAVIPLWVRDTVRVSTAV